MTVSWMWLSSMRVNEDHEVLGRQDHFRFGCDGLIGRTDQHQPVMGLRTWAVIPIGEGALDASELRVRNE